MVKSRRPVHLTELFLDRLRTPKRFCSNIASSASSIAPSTAKRPRAEVFSTSEHVSRTTMIVIKLVIDKVKHSVSICHVQPSKDKVQQIYENKT